MGTPLANQRVWWTDENGNQSSAVTDANGNATIAQTYNAPGSHTVTPNFTGSGNFQPSSAPSFQDVILSNAVQTVLTVTTPVSPASPVVEGTQQQIVVNLSTA